MYRNFQAKGLLPDRTLESFIKKAPTGQFLIIRKILTEFTKRIISKYIRKNLSGKKTERESNIIIFLLCLFCLLKNRMYIFLAK
jgi:hypothetical protein